MQGEQRQLCGWRCGFQPQWLQYFANTKSFIAVYGLLGTIQSAAFIYFVVTLSTLEKRFQIPSHTMGLVLSGNEISQILFSLILAYFGGQRNRPLWVAWGIVLCGISCYILALPHFLYGAGFNLQHLIKENQQHIFNDLPTIPINVTITKVSEKDNTAFRLHKLCNDVSETTYTDLDENEDCSLSGSDATIPLSLIFTSQFVLGIGTTLYFALGQTYLDDNTKKSRTPMMLAVALSLRLAGPMFGFILGHFSLNVFVEITKTPLIDKEDSRWIGAWWLGWMLLGSLMLIFALLFSLFPKELRPIKKAQKAKKYVLSLQDAIDSEYILDTTDNTPIKPIITRQHGFFYSIRRLLRNKVLMFNIISGIFYILGATPFMTFLTKYMEVQFLKSASESSALVGPVSVVGLIAGLLLSGVVLTRFRPAASKVLLWNAFVGGICALGQVAFIFTYCPEPMSSMLRNESFNLITTCNEKCPCENTIYMPVCHESTGTTFYSPCHAGCHEWHGEHLIYTNCDCLTSTTKHKINYSHTGHINNNNSDDDMFLNTSTMGLKMGACLEDCRLVYWTFAIFIMVINWLNSSGRIGNILVNYRVVDIAQKPLAQGLALMFVSLFALIPGPILFGAIMDATCLVWSETCSRRGYCQLYDQERFRYWVNSTASVLTALGVSFDILVWFYGRNMNLYEDQKQFSDQRSERQKRLLRLRDTTI